MKVFHDRQNGQLVYLGQSASPDFCYNHLAERGLTPNER